MYHSVISPLLPEAHTISALSKVCGNVISYNLMIIRTYTTNPYVPAAMTKYVILIKSTIHEHTIVGINFYSHTVMASRRMHRDWHDLGWCDMVVT